MAHNLAPGDRLRLIFPDRAYNAMYTQNFVGAGMLTLILNYAISYNEICLDMSSYAIRSVLVYDIGTKVTIEHYKDKTDYYDKIPHYIAGCSKDRADYATDEAYSNFRALTQGDLSDGKFYRSASSVVPFGTRHTCCDRLLENAGVENLLILNISDKNMEKYRSEEHPYTYRLYDSSHVTCIHLNPYLITEKEGIKMVMKYLSDTDGSIGISCNLGKDRTGMFCALIEALAGASYAEIREDFMQSFTNLYGIPKDSVEYETVARLTVDVFFYLVTNPSTDVTNFDYKDVDITTFDPYNDVHRFLEDYVGMTSEEIDRVIDSITGN